MNSSESVLKLKDMQPATRKSTKPKLFPTMILVSALSAGALLSGCNMVKQMTGGKLGGQPGATVPTGTPQPAAASKLDGYWKLAYSINGDVQSCHFNAKQEGDKVIGTGTDDHNDKAFTLENGHIQGQDIVFYKRYEHPDNPDQPPVEYIGKVNLAQVPPYMSGEFSVSLSGKEISGQWEAEKEGDAGQGPGGTPPAQAQQNTPPPAANTQPDKEPDLSGKWNIGFEYNFKTIQSSMFLEQLGNTLSGHGLDLTTNEKFVVEKGWYYYPKVTMIRKYPAVTDKGKVKKPERRMTFKAEVNWVDEPDYHGPYLSGKTDGGGNWEGQLVR